MTRASAELPEAVSASPTMVIVLWPLDWVVGGAVPSTIDATGDAVAVGAEHLVEHQKGQVHPGSDARFPGDHRRLRDRVGGDGGHGGHVRPVAQIFVERAGDRRPGLGQGLVGEPHHPHTTAGRVTVLTAIAGSVSG